MATKIRLQRHGKKRSAFYHIVIADARAKRDGRFIEKIGVYNPNTNPATIDLDFDRALYWVKTGAVPTDTARAILSYRGVLLKNHLDNGVKKGALTEAAAEKKFEAWMKEKDAKISGKTDEIAKAQEAAIAKQMADEKAKKEAYAAALTEKEAAAEAAPAEEGGEAAEEGGEAAEATTEEAPAAEEAPAEEAKAEEAPAEEEQADEPAKTEAESTDSKAEGEAEEAPAEDAKADASAEAETAKAEDAAKEEE